MVGDRPSFSVCIPNYNYARYLGLTIESVLGQTYRGDFEVIVADNASTDGSVAVAKSFGPKVRVIENRYNIGFAANLDRATFSAKKDYLLVLSSDDLMYPSALERYAAVLDSLGSRAHRAILTSAVDVIDSEGALKEIMYRPPGHLFYEQIPADRAGEIDLRAKLQIDRSEEALRETLRKKNSAAAFLATCYSRELYDEVEGYNNGYRMWPDGHFLNKILSRDTDLVYVPERLFAYRVHSSNQGSGEMKSGALKYQVDAYLHTLEFPEDVLSRIGVSRKELVEVFVEKAVMERGLQAVVAENRERALKCLAFGFATYPREAATEPKTYALAGLLALGPAGSWLAGHLYSLYRGRREAASG